MTGQTINRMENLPSEMRKIIRELMNTRTDRQSYAACSDLIASEMFDLSTCNSLSIEKTNKENVYKIRIGMQNSFDTIVTFKNVENNCEIQWNYFSVSLDDAPLIIENSNSEKEAVRMFEECLKRDGQIIETLELKKIDINFEFDSLPEFKKLKQMKIEGSNENVAKYFIAKVTTDIKLEVVPIGDNFSNEIISDLPHLEKIKSLKLLSNNITGEQLLKLATKVNKIEIQLGNMTIDCIKQFVILCLDGNHRINSKIWIVANSPFKMSDFRNIQGDFRSSALVRSSFENEKHSFSHNLKFVYLKSFRYQNRLRIRVENIFFDDQEE